MGMTTPRGVPLTKGAFQEMQQELEYLRTTRRREVAEEIRDAWDSELDKDQDVATPITFAKEDQAWVEGRIAALEDMLANADIIDEAAARDSDTVRLGSVVTVEANGQSRTYTMVGAAESDPGAGKLSFESPVGMALLGKHRGEVVQVDAPAGAQEWRITELK